MDRRTSWLFATLLGIGVGAGVFVWLVSNFLLAGTTALSYAVGTGLAFRHDDLLFGSMRSRGRSASLRSGALIGFLTLVAFFGPTELPIPTELGFAIGLLVLGVGFASLGLGIGIARAHRDEATDTDGGAAFSQSTRNP